ncbi:MAG: hypothetical protein ABSE56_05220 [Bryobacteraceae bacterium]|jgi:translation initiation factor IF-1
MRLFALIALSTALSFAQDARQIVLRSLELDSRNERIARNSTFVERNESREVDGQGRLKQHRVLTHDVTLLEGSPYTRLIARDDKPLSPAEERKEEEKLRKSIEQRRKETPDQRARRLADWEKKRREDHEPLLEIPEAFELRIAGEERVGGKDAWIIEATPRPGFRPKSRLARLFPKLKGRLWIDKQDSVWVKLEAEALDNISFGLFLVRLQKGARMTFEQTRVNDEVWLPKRATIVLAARVMLLKSIRAEVEATFQNYRKFQSESRLVGFEPPK